MGQYPGLGVGERSSKAFGVVNLKTMFGLHTSIWPQPSETRMASYTVCIWKIGYEKPGDNQIPSISYLGRTCWLNRCMEKARNTLPFLWVKHPPGSSIRVKLFSSRTNLQQWPLMKELELSESNEWLSFINKEISHLIHFTNIFGAIRYPHACTRTYSSLLHRTEYILSLHGEILTVVISVCPHWGGSVNLSDGDSKCVLLPLRMCSGGSGWVFMFVLALAFSTYPALGILKKTCPVPISVHCPHCVPLPSLVKVKTKPAQTLHC